MAVVLQVQRLMAWTAAASALLWGAFIGSAMLGLWFAAWIVGLVCGGISALTVAFRSNLPGWRPTNPARIEAGRLMVGSGLVYLAVLSVATVLARIIPPLATAALLTLVLADFAAGYHLVGNRLEPVPVKR